uniref:Cystic fibrosis transmembrane conductance regulator n=1 Tax=Eptatretus burgeri TaxID=7764 RepID=A0A8C4X1U4_EPTBU
QLEEDDMFTVLPQDSSEDLGERLMRCWKAELERASKKQGKPSLSRAIVHCFWKMYIILGFFAFTEEALRIIQPLLLGGLINYFQHAYSSQATAYLYAAGVSGCAFAFAIIHHIYFFQSQRIGMRIRVALCHLIYSKALRLSSTAMKYTTTGQVVNLLSNDVNRFDQVTIFMHYLWIGPLQAAAVVGLLWQEVGIACLAGISVLVILMPMQTLIGSVFSRYRRKTAIFTDNRIRTMSEVISGMRIIKMYTWEKSFSLLVAYMRKLEVAKIMKTSYLRGMNMAWFFVASKLILYFTFVTYALEGEVINARRVFVAVSFYNSVRLTVTLFFPNAIQTTFEAIISIKRIKVCCHSVPLPTLDDVSLSAFPGELVAVIGPVGSGKSSLLAALLGELPFQKGSLKHVGQLAYATQQSCVFPGTVRSNILFGSSYNKLHYNRVVKACALTKDLQLLAEGDMTVIGDRGITLSGGQKARINLARAVYQDADIYLLDDPLSAVDSEVGRFLFDNDPQSTEEDRGEGSVGMAIYLRYLRAGAGWFVLFIVLLMNVVAQVRCNLRMVPMQVLLCELTSNINMTEYPVLNLYNILACIPGRVLNRFSKDIGQMDDLLPFTMVDFMQLFLMIVGAIIVAVSVIPWLLILVLPLCGIFIFLRRYYLATSRDIKRLESTTRSPVFSHLSSSLIGLETIRVYKGQQRFQIAFDCMQDLHTASWFLFLTTSRWLAVRLDVLCAIFVTAVSFCSIFLANILDAGSVGLAVSYATSLTGMFQWGVRQSAEVENLMTSVERVMEYSDLKPEAAWESKAPPKNWPAQGTVMLDRVNFRYTPDGPLVLRNLSVAFQAKEKVGIVGRTGAGKSSLLTALFRLTELESGRVIIDDVVIADLGLHYLRRAISIIPQDPVLFTGSMRKNLDPFDEHSDTDLWNVLEEVQLRQAVEDLPGRLDSELAESGSNFSVGQRQLVCLARALLRHNRILVIDEATANVDPRTDALIQQTIRNKFDNCTVLTIAHRLNTIVDCDRILVMAEGQAREFASPHVLLERPDSLFSRLVEQAGHGEAQALRKTAYLRNSSDSIPTTSDFDIDNPRSSVIMETAF